MSRSTIHNAISNKNVRAFLNMLKYSEGTARESNAYAVCYGYSHTIKDFSDHPAITGEWTGKRLPDSMCKGAGITPPCKSTASGAYQIIKPTWQKLKIKLGLKDFSPTSQDLAAVQLIKERGALDDIISGNISVAINKCRKEWASLPNAGYGQGEKTLTSLIDNYKNNGGNIA